ncbi:MAG: acyl carrier protein [Candidatus Peribacteria bacterium]|nr:acyl carrier protein [Candidatus Peribacteria bacterium]
MYNCIMTERITPSDDEIFNTVQATIVEALGINGDEVSLDATLHADLGAESIDVIDIVFRLERNFNMRIYRHELFGSLDSDEEEAPEYEKFEKMTVQSIVSFMRGKLLAVQPQ